MTKVRDGLSVLIDVGPKVLPLTPVLDTSAYAAGDVLFVATEIALAVPQDGDAIPIQSLVVTDKDDLGLAFDLYFFEGSVAIGTINSAPSISDADAAKCLGRIRVDSSDYDDLGGARVATLAGIGIIVKAAFDSRSLWVAGIARAAGTHTASGLTLAIGTI